MIRKGNDMSRKSVSRRLFIQRTGALAVGAAAFPHIVPASAMGKDGAVAPSERITMGLIGTGNRGNGGSFHGPNG